MTSLENSGSEIEGQNSYADSLSLVDVVITCFNEGQYIEDAVQSVLDQTILDRVHSIFIVDDGSTKTTIEVLNDISNLDSRIKIDFGPGGNGVSAQRNLAISKGSAHYIAILDGDDIWEPDKLAQQIDLLDKRSEIGLVYSDYYMFADSDRGSQRRANATDLSQAMNQTQAYFLCDPPIIPSSTIIRRTVVESIGGFDENIRMFEDSDLWIRLSRISRFGFVNKPLIKKRYHKASLTGANMNVMPYHTEIALKAVRYDPDLLEFVPRRLAERARKLGNQFYLLRDTSAARRTLRLSIALYAFNPRSWASYLVVLLIPNLSYRVLKSRLEARRRALGFREKDETKS